MRRVLMLFCLCLPLLTSGCSALTQSMQKPTVRFDRAEFRAADFQTLRTDLVLDVTNNMPIGLSLSGYAMQFEVDGVTLVDGAFDQTVHFSAGGSTEVVIPVAVEWLELANKLAATDGKLPASLPWTARGELSFATPIGTISVPMGFDGDLPVLAPPTIQPKAVRVTQASPLSVGLAVDLEVSNPTGRAIDLAQFVPELVLGDTTVGSGMLSGSTVKGGATQIRTLELSFNPVSAGVAVASALATKGKLPVRARGQVDVATGFGVVPFTFDVGEELKLD